MNNEETQVEEETEQYDAYKALTNSRRGVQCPNYNCNDRIFSDSPNVSINCRCGLTWVTGGSKWLKYGVGFPFNLCDVRVVSEYQEPWIPTASKEEVLEVNEAELLEDVTQTEEVVEIPEGMSIVEEDMTDVGFAVEPTDVVVQADPEVE